MDDWDALLWYQFGTKTHSNIGHYESRDEPIPKIQITTCCAILTHLTLDFMNFFNDNEIEIEVKKSQNKNQNEK